MKKFVPYIIGGAAAVIGAMLGWASTKLPKKEKAETNGPVEVEVKEVTTEE